MVAEEATILYSRLFPKSLNYSCNIDIFDIIYYQDISSSLTLSLR